eukprot:UN14589
MAFCKPKKLKNMNLIFGILKKLKNMDILPCMLKKAIKT